MLVKGLFSISKLFHDANAAKTGNIEMYTNPNIATIAVVARYSAGKRCEKLCRPKFFFFGAQEGFSRYAAIGAVVSSVWVLVCGTISHLLLSQKILL